MIYTSLGIYTDCLIADPNIKFTSHLSEWLLSINQQTSASEDVEKGEPVFIFGGSAGWYSHGGKHIELPQKFKNRTVLSPSNSIFGDLSKVT